MFSTRERIQMFLQSDPDLWAVVLKSKDFSLVAVDHEGVIHELVVNPPSGTGEFEPPFAKADGK